MSEAKLASVAASRELYGAAHAGQIRVWLDIHRLAKRLHTSSATGSMSEIIDQYQEALDRYRREIKTVSEQVGAMFAIGGRIEGVELFDQPATLQSMFDKVLESFAIGALIKKHSGEVEISAQQVNSFLFALLSPNWSGYPGVGIGTEPQLDTAEIVATGLALEERVLHLAAFRLPSDYTRGGMRWGRDSFDTGSKGGNDFDLAA